MIKKSILLIILLSMIAIVSGTYLINHTINQPIAPSTPSITPNLPISTSITPTHTISPSSTTPTQGILSARIDQVNTTDLKLGRISFADITITNTGTEQITNERVEIVAGRDFGFPIGYQSRSFVQDFDNVVETNQTGKLIEQFSLPSSEMFIDLGGIYDVSVRVYANGYFVDDWSGKVPLYS